MPLCVDHTVSAVLERETVLEWISSDRKKMRFGGIGLSQDMKAPRWLRSLVSPLIVLREVFMVTGQLTILLGHWRFSSTFLELIFSSVVSSHPCLHVLLQK